MSTSGIHIAVAELLSFSRALPNRRLISSCRRGITPHGFSRVTALMAPLLLGRLKNRAPRSRAGGIRETKAGDIEFKPLRRSFFGCARTWAAALGIGNYVR